MTDLKLVVPQPGLLVRTSEIRWLKSKPDGTIETMGLQQLYTNLNTGEKEWRDVPMVEE